MYIYKSSIKIFHMKMPNAELRKFLKGLDKSELRSISSYDYQNLIKDHYLVHCTVEIGITLSVFREVRQFCEFSDDRWAKLLGFSPNTLRKYLKQDSHTFNAFQGQQILQIMNISIIGFSVFNDKIKFNQWLKEDILALNGEKPIDLLCSVFGQQLVLKELCNIEYGIFV